MTTPMEAELRRGLRQLVDQPGPPNLADQALRAASRTRRRRRVGLVLAAAAVVGVTVAAVPGGAMDPPIAGPSNETASPSIAPDLVCQSFTHGPDIAVGVPSEQWPDFVRVIIAASSRDDYVVESGSGFCEFGGECDRPRIDPKV